MDTMYDVIVIGGGINGCGIAADAAMRGLSVTLIEKDDLASKTSSHSSKLIHGGLRYLEHYDFKLVRKALKERQQLLALAPHLVRPLAFVIPYHQKMRAPWLLRTGLFIYDHLYLKNKLPKSKTLTREDNLLYFLPLKSLFQKGFLYYDCTANDARLTLANAKQAQEYGALMQPQKEFVKGRFKKDHWLLEVKNKDQEPEYIRAKVVINATGPWVSTIDARLGLKQQMPLCLVKGSHLLVDKLYTGDYAYLLQHDDKRVIFTIPFFNKTLIGTTDVPYKGSLEKVGIDEEEISYLLQLTNNYFNQSLSKKDILATYSGVRTLLKQDKDLVQAMSRDYSFRCIREPAPILSIYGGKITTYRQLAKEAIDALKPFFPNLQESKTAKVPLPGSKPVQGLNYEQYCQHARKQYHWLPEDLLNRYLGSYGTLTGKLLGKAQSMKALGINFGLGLFQREVDYLVQEEWANTTEDILYRRTQLGFDYTEKEKSQLEAYMKARCWQNTAMNERIQ